jgi:hypothetical protein
MKSGISAWADKPGESGIDDIRKFGEFIEFRLEVTRVGAR